jgi:ribosome-associated protein
MDGDVVTPGGITIPASSMTWRFSRGTGPGGQGVNTTDSRVELVVDVTALDAPTIRIVVTTERSQLRNREAAVDRLVARLDAAATPERPRTPTRPTRSSVRARLDTKRQLSRRKADRRDPGEDGG